MSAANPIDVHGLSHIGRVRRANQDHFLVGRIHKSVDIVDSNLPPGARGHLKSAPLGHLLVVADGVGGSAGGEEASSAALDGLIDYITGSMPCFLGSPDAAAANAMLDELQAAVAASHQRVRIESQKDPELQDMATTLTLAYLQGQMAYIFHVGDSRCYLMRDGEIIRVTRDQTYAQELVDRGVWTQEVADDSVLSRYLSSSVGGSDDSPTALVYELPIRPGDTLVLCSDGLTKYLRDGDIAAHLDDCATAEESCCDLVEAALEGGGSDNITVIVARLKAPDSEDVSQGRADSV